MSVLSAADRHAHRGAASKFALSGERFPIGDAVHARLAIPMASRSEHKGNITAAQAAHVKSAARAELGHGHGSKYPGLAKGDKRAVR
jgi:hypothetical protein